MDLGNAPPAAQLALAIVAGLTFGALIGSFVATVAIRWPQGLAVASGRSRCDACAAPLRWTELIPLLSFAVQRGRCRRCGAAIDRGHPSIELACAAIGAAAFAAHGPVAGLVTATLGCWLLLLAVLDHRFQWLPDALTLPLIPAGLAAALAGIGPPLGDRLIGAAAGAATLWLIAAGYRAIRGREGLGGGDPKLFAGIGAWLGWASLPFVLLGSALLGLAFLLLLHARGTDVGRDTRLPFGTFLAIAAWAAWLLAAAPG